MNRTIKQWANCDPKAMAVNQSEAARFFAFADAKHDILFLHNKNTELLQALERVLKVGRGVSGRIILEQEDEQIIIAAITAAKGE